MQQTVAEIYAKHKDAISERGVEIANMTGAEMRQYLSTRKKSKFKARAVVIDEIFFRSTLEGRYYSQLKLQVKSGHIREFKRQVVFPLIVNGVKVCKYICDFVTLNIDGTHTVIDVKGKVTEPYRLKRALMLALYGIKIVEIKAK